MLKKFLAVVFSIVMIFPLLVSCGQGVKGTKGLEFHPLSDGTYGVSAGDALYLEEIVIPAKHKGKAVTQIVSEAFKGADNLKKITIPDTITSVGKDAFLDCKELDDVYTSNLEAWLKITYKNGNGHPNVNGELHILDEKGNELTEIVIPDSITKIDDYMFANCKSLTSVTFSENGNLTKIGVCAFKNCKKLKSITFPDSVTSIGAYAFEGSGLESITVTNGVTSIYGGEFIGCTELTSVIIQDGVTSLGDLMFRDCSKLTSIVIPDSVTEIGVSTFKNCSSLSAVYYGGTKSDWNGISISNVYNEALTSATRYYYSETQPTKSGNYWRYVDGVPTAW